MSDILSFEGGGGGPEEGMGKIVGEVALQTTGKR